MFFLDLAFRSLIHFEFIFAYSVRECYCSVTKLCPTLCNPMDCSTPGFPVLCYLPEFAQTQVHWVIDTIQPSHLLSSSSPALNLFQWVSSSYQVTEVLECQLQHQSFQWIFSVFFFPLDQLVWSPCSPRDSQESSPTTTIQKHQFFGAQPSQWSKFYIHTWLLEKP